MIVVSWVYNGKRLVVATSYAKLAYGIEAQLKTNKNVCVWIVPNTIDVSED